MTRRRIVLLVLGLVVVAGALAATAVHEWWEEREEAKIEEDLCRVGAGQEDRVAAAAELPVTCVATF